MTFPLSPSALGDGNSYTQAGGEDSTKITRGAEPESAPDGKKCFVCGGPIEPPALCVNCPVVPIVTGQYVSVRIHANQSSLVVY